MKADAVRHTCRTWTVHSIPFEILFTPCFHSRLFVQLLILRSKTDPHLLTYMLKRGDWWAAAVANKAALEQELFQNTRYMLLALSPYMRSLLRLNVWRPEALLNPVNAMRRNAEPRSEILIQSPVPKLPRMAAQ